MFELERVIKCLYVLLKKQADDLSDEELVQQLGRAAIEQVKSNLKQESIPANGENNLLMLCVALTYYQYALIMEQHSLPAINIGSVSVGKEDKRMIDAAKQLKDYYSRATRKYMKTKLVEFKNI